MRERSPARRTWTVALLSSGALCACVGTNGPCASADGCPGAECIANRCVPSGADPVPPGSERLVLEPRAVAVAGNVAGPSSPTVTLGAADHSEVLYLTFAQVPEGRRVQAAFLLLEPAAGTDPNLADVPLSVWAVPHPAPPARSARGARPKLGPPEARGVARSTPRATTRIDVTEMVTVRGDGPRGLAVVATSDVERGVTLLSGNAAGAPRLEVYLAPPSRR